MLAKTTTTIAKAALIILANLVVVALLGEGIARMAFDPFQYLEPKHVDDEALTLRVLPNSNGHDDWGFRNFEVPDTADLVAIGDSWTYGSAARPSESWPSWFQHDEGQSVYNLAVFGYAPTDYLHLLKTRAAELEPKVVVLGFSYSSDFLDAYVRVDRKDYWSRFREGRDFDPASPRPPAHSAGGLVSPWEASKRWLRRNSLLWQLVETGPIVRAINDIGRRQNITEFTTCHIDTIGPFHTVVSPDFAMDALDLEKPYIRAGMDISQEILLEMAEIAREMDVRFVVALFPTKERVHEGRLANADDSKCKKTFERLMRYEAQLDREMKAFLKEHEIEHLDLLPALRRASERERLFQERWDVHPNGAGYRAISRAIADHLAAGPVERASGPSQIDSAW